MNAYIYILTNSTHSVLYIGVTNNLVRRIYEHKNRLLEGFTCDYSVNRLVHYEQFDNIVGAITREKQLKNWHRAWKENLIAGSNPTWCDLYDEIIL
ncbi:GIY-YIG nuclease family protein [Candidatus Avelusimicrobium sp.]|uniref:GIY-YIG nuclease family protein n=1 Tax=Candidatus Avelusimicrobium sp. TaxID=3048833 RepID=UPI003D7E8843